MTDGLLQRDPGSSLPTHFERMIELLAAVVVIRYQPDNQVPQSFSRDEATMRRIAVRLRDWTGEPGAD